MTAAGGGLSAWSRASNGQVPEAFLRTQLDYGLEDAQTDARKLVCYDCGVACDLSAMRTERVGFLEKLDAKVKRLPVVREPAPAKKGPPVKFDQGEPRRYRFAYTKIGPSAFLSQASRIRPAVSLSSRCTTLVSGYCR